MVQRGVAGHLHRHQVGWPQLVGKFRREQALSVATSVHLLPYAVKM